jgi:hypothetical protein
MIRELERFQCREDRYEAEVVSPRQTSTPVKNGSRQIGESRDSSELLEAQGHLTGFLGPLQHSYLVRQKWNQDFVDHQPCLVRRLFTLTKGKDVVWRRLIYSIHRICTAHKCLQVQQGDALGLALVYSSWAYFFRLSPHPRKQICFIVCEAALLLWTKCCQEPQFAGR